MLMMVPTIFFYQSFVIASAFDEFIEYFDDRSFQGLGFCWNARKSLKSYN